MSWFAVDDRFHSHRKVASLRRGPHYAAAVAVWTLSGSWACSDESARDTGRVPLDVIAGFGLPDWELAVKELDRVGLVAYDEADDSATFHDWEFWNGPGAAAKRLEKRRESDRIRQQNRRSQTLSRDGHVTNRRQSSDQPVTRGKGYGFGLVEEPQVNKNNPSSANKPKPVREDALRLCEHLADRVERNGSKRPSITVRWLDAARHLMDLDGRTEEQIHRAIDWCQDDEFWRANVMSMPTLRAKYDTLRLRAQANGTGGGSTRPAPAGSGVWDRKITRHQEDQ